MKTLVVLGLLITMALVAPVATAHLVIQVGNSNDCNDGNVVDVPVVHGGFWVGPCERNHANPPPALP